MPVSEQQDLFIKKLKQCCIVFDFMDPVTDLKSKEIKRACLNCLVDFQSHMKQKQEHLMNDDDLCDILNRCSFRKIRKGSVYFRELFVHLCFMYISIQCIETLTLIWNFLK